MLRVPDASMSTGRRHISRDVRIRSQAGFGASFSPPVSRIRLRAGAFGEARTGVTATRRGCVSFLRGCLIRISRPAIERRPGSSTVQGARATAC